MRRIAIGLSVLAMVGCDLGVLDSSKRKRTDASVPAGKKPTPANPLQVLKKFPWVSINKKKGIVINVIDYNESGPAAGFSPGSGMRFITIEVELFYYSFGMRPRWRKHKKPLTVSDQFFKLKTKNGYMIEPHVATNGIRHRFPTTKISMGGDVRGVLLFEVSNKTNIRDARIRFDDLYTQTKWISIGVTQADGMKMKKYKKIYADFIKQRGK